MKASAMSEVSFKKRPALSDAEKIVNLQRECQRLSDEADRLRELLDEQRNALASATVAEARQRGAMDIADEVRRRLQEKLALYRKMPVTNFDYMAGFSNGLTLAIAVLDELAPPTSEPEVS